MSESTAVPFDDMQGLLRFAHGHMSEAAFLLLRVKDIAAAGAWLDSAEVSTAVKTEPPPETALQLAFTAPGLAELGLSRSTIDGFAVDFLAGMNDPRRARRHGDVGHNAPENWRWGGVTGQIPHLMLMLYAKDGKLAGWKTQTLNKVFGSAFEILAQLPVQSHGDREPFGFVDGISQPILDWEQKLSTDLHERDQYTNLLKVGEVVLGYLNEYGEYTDRPLLDEKQDPMAGSLPAAVDQPGKRDLGRNGSYLILRQLEQDVSGFWRFLDQAVASDQQQRERLAAKMVGRQRDGAPLVATITPSIPGAPNRPDNHFTFEPDLDGLVCPVGAHIRRANPRTGDFPPGVSGMVTRLIRILGFGRGHPDEDLIASTRFHRLLRRGRTYGEPITPEEALVEQPSTSDPRGLHFICLAGNITRQFEFVQTAWIASGKFAGVQNESDPLLGNREPLINGERTDHFHIPTKEGPTDRVSDLPRFITVRGGAYFFMPGIRALRYIAGVACGNGGPS